VRNTSQKWFSKSIEILKKANVEVDMTKVVVKAFDGVSVYFVTMNGLTIEVNLNEGMVLIYSLDSILKFKSGVKQD